MSRLALVYRVSNVVHLVDPFTLRAGEVSSEQFWFTPFSAIGSRSNLTEYTVIDSEEVGGRVCVCGLQCVLGVRETGDDEIATGGLKAVA